MRKKTSTMFAAIATACACAAWSVLSAQSTTTDACSVLTRDEIKTLSGNHDPGPPRPSGTGHSTICYWESESPKGSVVLWDNVDPHEPKGLGLKQLLERGKKARAVPGLGDDAVFVESPSEDPGGNLLVRVGHWRVSIYREAATPTATSESVLPLLTAFAKAAIPRLRRAG